LSTEFATLKAYNLSPALYHQQGDVKSVLAELLSDTMFLASSTHTAANVGSSAYIIILGSLMLNK
jgi:hypothetical protein